MIFGRLMDRILVAKAPGPAGRTSNRVVNAGLAALATSGEFAVVAPSAVGGLDLFGSDVIGMNSVKV